MSGTALILALKLHPLGSAVFALKHQDLVSGVELSQPSGKVNSMRGFCSTFETGHILHVPPTKLFVRVLYLVLDCYWSQKGSHRGPVPCTGHLTFHCTKHFSAHPITLLCTELQIVTYSPGRGAVGSCCHFTSLQHHTWPPVDDRLWHC